MKYFSRPIKLCLLAYLVLCVAILASYGADMPVYLVDLIIASMLFVLFGLPLLYLIVKARKSSDRRNQNVFWKIFSIGLAATIIVTIIGSAYVFLR